MEELIQTGKGDKMASIRDVAKRANVAPSTVSLVLNSSGYVSEETRAKVEKAMKELDYVPNAMARNLFRNKTNIVGIIVPDIAHPFFSTFVKYAEKELYLLGYKTMICGTMGREEVEKEYLEMLRMQVMDGIIMCAHTLEIEEYVKVKRPMIAIDRYLEGIPVVGADHELGGRLAAAKFSQTGCRQVIQITGAKIVGTPAHESHRVLKEELNRAGVQIKEIEMGWNCFEPEDFLRTAEEVFEKYPDADGIFGADMAVLACMQYAVREGRKIPEELQMIAYDGTYITDLNEHPVSAVVQPLRELACCAAREIVAYIDGKKPQMRTTVSVELKDRGTTR